MNELLEGQQREAPTSRLAVFVHRELNVDADRLSHPHLYDEVRTEAEAAGWRVHRLRAAAADDERLSAALQRPPGRFRYTADDAGEPE